MSKHPIFVSSSRGAPSVLPVYKVDANNKDRVKRGGGLLGSVIFVFFSTLIFIFFFVSIYWGTTFLQTHVDEENSLNRGLPGTRNIIRKWSKKTLSGFDITELGNPPGKHSYHTDDPAAFSEEEEAEEAEEEEEDEEEEDAEEISAQEAEADAEAEEGEFIEGEVVEEEEEEEEGEPLQDIGEEGEEEFISSGDDARAREGEQEQEQEEEAEEEAEAEAGEEEQEQAEAKEQEQ